MAEVSATWRVSPRLACDAFQIRLPKRPDDDMRIGDHVERSVLVLVHHPVTGEDEPGIRLLRQRAMGREGAKWQTFITLNEQCRPSKHSPFRNEDLAQIGLTCPRCSVHS